MKRATFLIPLAGAAASSCVTPIIEEKDPIIGTWALTALDGVPYPLTDTYVNANGVSCTSTLGYTFSVDDALSVQYTLALDTLCADGSSDSTSDSTTGTVTVIQRTIAYTINLPGGAASCGMSAGVSLDCNNPDGKSAQWSLLQE